MIIKSFETYIDIEGFEYPVTAKYTKGTDGSIDITDILIRNSEEEFCEFPYLKEVDNLIIEQIEEYERYGLD